MIKLPTAPQESALDLNEMMKHRLTNISLPLFNIDGTIRKAMKSKLLECLNFTPEKTTSNISIIDMGLLWRVSMPTKEYRETPKGSS